MAVKVPYRLIYMLLLYSKLKRQYIILLSFLRIINQQPHKILIHHYHIIAGITRRILK